MKYMSTNFLSLTSTENSLESLHRAPRTSEVLVLAFFIFPLYFLLFSGLFSFRFFMFPLYFSSFVSFFWSLFRFSFFLNCVFALLVFLFSAFFWIEIIFSIEIFGFCFFYFYYTCLLLCLFFYFDPYLGLGNFIGNFLMKIHGFSSPSFSRFVNFILARISIFWAIPSTLCSMYLLIFVTCFL